MSDSDFAVLGGSSSLSLIRRGATYGIPRPNGGGDFVHAFHAPADHVGAVGLYSIVAGSSPTPSGGSIRGALQRGVTDGPLGCSVGLFFCADANTISANAYILGLEDGDPGHIVLRKGQLVNGLPGASLGTQGILRRSETIVIPGDWLHLRLDAVVNTNGDVVLNAFRSSLAAHPVTTPVWEAIPGIDQYIDDVTGVNTGSAPLLAGRAGFVFSVSKGKRRAYVDHIEIQTQP